MDQLLELLTDAGWQILDANKVTFASIHVFCDDGSMACVTLTGSQFRDALAKRISDHSETTE